MTTPLLWIDGTVVDGDSASVPALDQSALIGDGVFETIRLIDGRARFLDRHLDRLGTACARVALDHPGDDVLRRAIDELVETSGLTDGRVRISISGGTAGLGPGRGDSPTVVVAVGTAVVPTGAARLLRGPWARNERSPLAGVKSSSWAENAALLRLARDAGCDDVLLSDSQGHLSECAASNVFVVLDGQAVTPTLDSGCLPGIVRAVLLDRGVAQEVVIDDDSIDVVTEAFITSSFVGVRPVAMIGGRSLPIVDGERTRAAADTVHAEAAGML